MVDIRELVRYEIPGYICIAYALLLLLPFIKFDWLGTNPVFFEWLGFILAFIASGIPLGWFLFQIYRGFLHEYLGDKYVWRKPNKILDSWDKKGKTSRYFRINLMDYALFKSGLRPITGRYWAHVSSRYIIGLIVPIASPLLAGLIYVLAQLTPFSTAFDYSNTRTDFFISAIIWLAFFVILSLGVFWRTSRTLVQIQNFIVLSLIEHRKSIEELINYELTDEGQSQALSNN